jgi:hypothetical protein
MKTKHDYKCELDKLKVRAERLDYLMLFIGLGLVVMIGYLIFSANDNPIISLIITIIAGYVPFQLVGKLHDYLRPRYAKQYVIVDDDGVRKLFGSFGLVDRHLAYRDLLKPGYKIHQGNSFEEYGCTLAAIKCEQSDIKVISQLRAHNIDTSTTFG